MKKLLTIITLNLLIGNVIAWFMGAAPIDFAPVAYSAQEQQLVTELVTELGAELTAVADDPGLQTQLGAIYSLHNQLNQAEFLLAGAVAADPGDSLALAWLSGTRAKQAGAMFDPLMGLVKLYRLHGACAGLIRAVTLDPDNFEIRMVRLATFAPTATLNCDLATAFADEAWFKSFFAAQGKDAPTDLKLQFNLSMSQAYANAYINAGDETNRQQAQQYMKAFKQLAQGITLTPLLGSQLAETRKLLAEST